MQAHPESPFHTPQNWPPENREEFNVRQFESLGKEEKEKLIQKYQTDFTNNVDLYFNAELKWRYNPRELKREKAAIGSNFVKAYIRVNALYANFIGTDITFPGTDTLRLKKYMEARAAKTKSEELPDVLISGAEHELFCALLFSSLQDRIRKNIMKSLQLQHPTSSEEKRDKYARDHSPKIYFPRQEEDTTGGVDLWVDFTELRSQRFAHLQGKVLAVSAKYKNTESAQLMVEDPIFPVKSDKDIEMFRDIVDPDDQLFNLFEKNIEKIREISALYNNVIPCLMIGHSDMRLRADKSAEIAPIPGEAQTALVDALSRKSFVET